MALQSAVIIRTLRPWNARMCRTKNELAKVPYSLHVTYFLSVEYIIVTPKLADAEGLVKSAVFVCFGEEPRRIHEIFALSGYK